ncbi:hypothetical protein J4E90_003207 [Alternaria incomplexa]|uniref:uncharacterized protein n=1 Tax=Alternaria incomplexa TaxID=1187928 RepID=UPI00221F9CCA|nr:uncharacterized protein J4E90_003207 [Alternaria incomplexa]KAI4916704.1 hypothetical protein J4E90_003207 [Alternaria incomplexa]
MDRTHTDRQDGGDGLPPSRTEDNDPVDEGEDHSSNPARRGGGPGRAGRMNTISEEPPLTGHDQGQDTNNTAETTRSRLERRAAEIREANRRRRAHGQTNSDTSGNTPYTQGVGRPLERATGRALVGTGGYTPFGSGNFQSSVPGQSSHDDGRNAAVYDPGSFEDTDQFYVEPAPKPENVDPKAMVSQPEGKPEGDSNPPKRKDEPDDKQSGGRGPGAPGQAT